MIEAQNVKVTEVSFSLDQKLTEDYTDNDKLARPVSHQGYTKEIFLVSHILFEYDGYAGSGRKAGTAVWNDDNPFATISYNSDNLVSNVEFSNLTPPEDYSSLDHAMLERAQEVANSLVNEEYALVTAEHALRRYEQIPGLPKEGSPTGLSLFE